MCDYWKSKTRVDCGTRPRTSRVNKNNKNQQYICFLYYLKIEIDLHLRIDGFR